jgi:hypothetical protein
MIDYICCYATAQTLYLTQKVDRLFFDSSASSTNVAGGDQQTRH